MPAVSRPQKIAVLGGGMSALTSVLELTSQPDWQKKYEITLYQLGWRLGGKGASGRNADVADRIEEHGVHLWFGCYDNAFHVIRKVYEENARPLGQPLALWNEVFKPYDFLVMEELLEGKWQNWPIKFPTNDRIPGDYVKHPTVWGYIHNMLDMMWGMYKDFSPTYELIDDPTPWSDLIPEFLSEIWNGAKALGLDVGAKLIFTAMKMVNTVDNWIDKFGTHPLIDLLDKLMEWLWHKVEHAVAQNTAARRMWILFDLGTTVIKGLVADDVVRKGFDVINDIDFRAWLRKHGASDLAVESAVVQSIYGLVFCGRNQKTYEAGTLIRTVLRFFMTYNGALFYRMQAGMGDAIFAPIYEVLQRRGVQFRFFHRLRDMGLSADGSTIDTLTIGRQATLKKGDYAPLVDVKSLPCWPSTPLYDQLKEGKTLKTKNINLESWYADWPDIETLQLKRGTDFDLVIFGLSLGAVPHVCKELLAARESWQQMVQNVAVTATQSAQTWLSCDIAGMGWPYWPQQPAAILGSYAEPLDSWADMSDVINAENWGDGLWPNHISYFTGPFFNVSFPPDFSDHSFPARMLEQVKAHTLQYMRQHAQHLWPDTWSAEEQRFRWEVLVAPENVQGADRLLLHQFFKANIEPTDLYVLAEVNSSASRLKTDETGFNNLLITGDWIQNGFNAGCIEAAVIAGMQTARAILGHSTPIAGEHDVLG